MIQLEMGVPGMHPVALQEDAPLVCAGVTQMQNEGEEWGSRRDPTSSSHTWALAAASLWKVTSLEMALTASQNRFWINNYRLFTSAHMALRNRCAGNEIPRSTRLGEAGSSFLLIPELGLQPARK